MIPLGIFAKTFRRPTVFEVFKAVRDHSFPVTHFNFECAGLDAMPIGIPEPVLEEIRSAKFALSIGIAGVSATFNMAHPEEAVRLDGLKRLDVIARACSALDTGLVTLCTGSRHPVDKWKFHAENKSRGAWNDLVKSMEKAILIAEKYDLQLGVEPELANVINTVQKAYQLLSEMGSSRLKIVLDPANLFEVADEEKVKRLIEEAIEQLGPAIVMAHAKDRNRQGNFVPPGQGVIPFDFFLKKLKEAGISCPLIAHGFSEEYAGAVREHLHRLVDESDDY